MKKPETVPTIALELLAASTAGTAHILQSLADAEKARADKLQAELDEARRYARAVSTLHRMLSEPLYARRLISLLKTGHFGAKIAEEDD